MSKTKNLKEQLEAFEKGIYLNNEGKDSWCYNFYDWFCRDTSLKLKANKLFKATKTFVSKMNVNTESTYVFFKNNCPMSYSLYDDFRICDIKTGKVIWCVIPSRILNDKSICEIWGTDNKGVFKNLYTGKNMREFYFHQSLLPLDKWIKQLRYQKNNVVWVDKFGTKHTLWSKTPNLDGDGTLKMINKKTNEIEYYDWIVINKPELLKK
tara:strand:+ start:519 stop:1145 length:627 start_codon:yes stop_codon:yes gene_type:complete